MTVQTKKVISDTGSAVVAEAVSQLNRAAAYTSIIVDFDASGGADDVFAHLYFHEDVYLSDITVGFTGAANLSNADDDIFIYLNDTPDATTPTQTVFSAEGFNGTDLVAGAMYTLQEIADTADAASGGDTSLPVRVDAGTLLVCRADILTATSGVLTFSVMYRPVKDELVLQPNGIPNKLKSWSTRDR